MSLRRIDLRFALPHEVRRAAAIGLEDWSTGLEEAGVDLSADSDLDLAVAPVERANEVLELGARSARRRCTAAASRKISASTRRTTIRGAADSSRFACARTAAAAC